MRLVALPVLGMQTSEPVHSMAADQASCLRGFAAAACLAAATNVHDATSICMSCIQQREDCVGQPTMHLQPACLAKLIIALAINCMYSGRGASGLAHLAAELPLLHVLCLQLWAGEELQLPQRRPVGDWQHQGSAGGGGQTWQQQLGGCRPELLAWAQQGGQVMPPCCRLAATQSCTSCPD